MKKFLLTYIFSVLIFNVCNSQIAVFQAKTFVDSVSQPGLKKYGLKISFDGLNLPVNFRVEDNYSHISYFGDSIPHIFDNISCLHEIYVYAFNPNNINDQYASISSCPGVKNRIILDSIINATSGCNAGFKFKIDTTASTCATYSFATQYESYYSPGNPFTPNWLFPVYPGNGSTTVNNLCSGRYYIQVQQTPCLPNCTGVNNYDHLENIVFFIGQSSFPIPNNLDISVNPYNQANTPTCNGKANVSVLNASPPFLYSFDNSSYSSIDSVSNLCEGLHTVKVKNATDSAAQYFIISNTNSVINNPNPYGPVVDTVIYNYTNCNFNYNLPIDSAFIVNYSQIDTNTIFLSWQIWQAGVSTSISDTISYLYQSGTSMVSLMIFCGNARTTNTSSFKTFRVNDFVLLNQTVGIKENKKDGMDIKLYPNPFSSSISIQSKLISSIKSVEMINLIGEVIEIKHQINNQEIVLDTDNLKSGFYTISIISKSGQKSSYKVIKQ